MHSELDRFALLALVVAGGFFVAIASSKLTDRVPVPTPAIFLGLALLAGWADPAIARELPTTAVERIGIVALVIIVFDGGLHIGWARFSTVLWPVLVLGALGTVVTAALLGAASYVLLGLPALTSVALGAALSPTDPAAVFSVLGDRKVGGRSSTLLQGESAFNDPVSIAIVLAVAALASPSLPAAPVPALALGAVASVALQLAVGVVAGLAGGLGMLWLARHASLPAEGLYPLRALAGAGVVYGGATLLGGSGFVGVLVAGIVLGDARMPFRAEIARFHDSMANLSQIALFSALGLSIPISLVAAGSTWVSGLVLAVLLTFVARPIVVAVLLWPTRLSWRERAFVMWGGLKGGVPILLGIFILLARLPMARTVYGIVFVTVAFSVVLQGGALPAVARLLSIELHQEPQRPFRVSIGLSTEPQGVVHHYVVPASSPAEGIAIRDLPLGSEMWISFVVRDGVPVQPRGSFRVKPGDELVVMASEGEVALLPQLFEGPGPPAAPG